MNGSRSRSPASTRRWSAQPGSRFLRLHLHPAGVFHAEPARHGARGAIHTAAEDGRVAMVDARDVAAVAVDALISHRCEGQTHTLTGPQALCFDEVAEILSEQIGTRIRHVRIPPNAVRNVMQRNGVEAWFAQDMAQLHTMLQPDTKTSSPTRSPRSPAPHHAPSPNSAGISPTTSPHYTPSAEPRPTPRFRSHFCHRHTDSGGTKARCHEDRTNQLILDRRNRPNCRAHPNRPAAIPGGPPRHPRSPIMHCFRSTPGEEASL